MVMECKTCNRIFRYIYSENVICPKCKTYLQERTESDEQQIQIFPDRQFWDHKLQRWV
jgi:phage FluMu protein Com